jgi:GABA permease
MMDADVEGRAQHAGMRSSSNARVRNWGAKTNVALIFASIAVVVVAALVTAFVIDPPVLGWVGFAIASAVVFGLGAAATLLIPRMRVSALIPAAATDQERRLLVVADAYCSEAGLCVEIRARLEDAVAVHVVVPVRVSHLHFLANDEAEERRDAEQTMLMTVALLRQSGIRATGAVGSDKPLESMTDALGAFPATHVLLATPPAEESYWLERDLLAKARALTELRVTHATVASGSAGELNRSAAASAAAERSISTEGPRPAERKATPQSLE